MAKDTPKASFLTGPKRQLIAGNVQPVGGTGPANPQFRDGWFFEPLQPTAPLAPRQQRPRRFEYVPGHNLIWTPREGIGVGFSTLRTLSYALDVLRVVIELVKGSIRGLEWEVRPKRKEGESRVDYGKRSRDDEVAAQLKEFLEFPDGQQSFDAWLNEAVEEMLVIDGWSIYLEKDESGKIANLRTIDGACYSDDTEVLTRRGWLRFEDVDISADEFATRNQQTKEFEWQKATYRHDREYSGDMYHFHSRGVDILVSPNHRMLVSQLPVALGGNPRRKGDVIVRAEDLARCLKTDTAIPMQSGWMGTEINEREFKLAGGSQSTARHFGPSALSLSCSYCGSGFQAIRAHEKRAMFCSPACRSRSRGRIVMTGDQYCAFMGMWLAEGSVSRHDGKTIYVSQRKESKGFDEFRVLLEAIFGSVRHDGDKFIITNRALNLYLRQFGYAPDKYIPEEIRNTIPRQIDIFWKYYWLGDGHADRDRITTSSLRMADGLVELAQKRGKSASVMTKKPGRSCFIQGREVRATGPHYVVSVRGSSVMRMKASKVPYSGWIRCISVPNEILYVRRNGKPAWCGNTIAPLVTVDGFTPRPPAPAYYQVLYGIPAFLLTTDDLIYAPFNRVMRGPTEFSLYGYPPVEFVLLAINQLLRSEQWQLDFFTQGSIPDAIAGVPSSWSPKQIDELQNWFDAINSGNMSSRRRLRFIPTVQAAGGERMNIVFPKLEGGGFKPEYPLWLARVISAAFRVSSLWAEKMLNRATAEEASSLSEEFGVKSFSTHIARAMNVIIQYKMGQQDHEFVFKPRTESDPLKRMQVETGYQKEGTKTVNEVREDIGLDPYTDPRASQPVIITATGAVALFPDETQDNGVDNGGQQNDGGDSENDGQPKKKPLPGAKPKPDEKTDANDKTDVGKRRVPRVTVDEDNPLLDASRNRIARAVLRAGNKFKKQLLTSPQLLELDKAHGKKKTDHETEEFVTLLLAGLPNYYAEEQEDLERSLFEAAHGGILVGSREGQALPPAEERQLYEAAHKWATDRVGELIKGIDQTTRNRVRTIIENALENNVPFPELEQELEEAGAFSEARAKMIARTEVGNAMMRTNLEAWKASGATDYVKWLVGEDPCPICLANAGLVRKIGEPFPSGDESPLAHPNCCCSLAPARAPNPEKVEKKDKTDGKPLYLGRHGSTPLNREKRVRGQSGVGLDANGRRIVTESAESIAHLGIKKVVSSNVRRAKESAAIYGRVLGVPVEYDDDLDAWDVPRQFIGEPSDVLDPYIADPDKMPPGGDETLNDFRKRAVKAVEKRQKQSAKDGPDLVITHNSVMMAVKEAKTGQKPRPGQRDPVPPGGVLELREDKFKRVA